MVDAPDDEVVALLAAGPDAFVATRTARVRALRAEGRREEAAALARVRKPLRLTWVLVEVQRSRPELVAEVVEAAEALAEAQAGGGGRIRPLVAELRTGLDRIAEAARAVAPDSDGAQAALLARQVIGDADARRAWGDGRLLAPPAPDTEGGIEASARPAGPTTGEAPARRARRRRPTSAATGTDEDDAAGDEAEERTRREVEEAHREAEQAQREAEEQAAAVLRAARHAREEASGTLERLEGALDELEDQVEALVARRDAARTEVERAREEVARREAEVEAAEAGQG